MQESCSSRQDDTATPTEIDIRRCPWLWSLTLWFPGILALLTLTAIILWPKPAPTEQLTEQAILGIWEGKGRDGAKVLIYLNEEHKYLFGRDRGRSGKGMFIASPSPGGLTLELRDALVTSREQYNAVYFVSLHENVLVVKFQSGWDVLQHEVFRRKEAN